MQKQVIIQLIKLLIYEPVKFIMMSFKTIVAVFFLTALASEWMAQVTDEEYAKKSVHAKKIVSNFTVNKEKRKIPILQFLQ